MGRTEYWNDPVAPRPNSLVPSCGVLATDEAGRILLQRRRDTGQWAIPMGRMELGETPSQLGRPVSGAPTANDEASEVAWVAADDLGTLDIHPTQWRQLRDYLSKSWPHVG